MITLNLTAQKFAARLLQANLASKTDIANSVKKTDFNDKLNNLNKNVSSNKTKHTLVKNELNELSKITESNINKRTNQRKWI